METNLTVKCIDEDKDKKWDDFILSHDKSSLYHHSLWKKLIYNTYGYKPIYFTIEDLEDNIRGGMACFFVKTFLTGKRLVSLPFSDFCDPLVRNAHEFDLIMGKALSIYINQNVSYAEFKTVSTIQCFEESGLHAFKKIDLNKNHLLNLSQPLEELQGKFHKNHIQRNIRKALKSNLIVKEAKDEEDIKTFYELSLLTRKRHGLPPHPFTFFRNMWDLFTQHNMAHVLIAYDNGKPIGAIFNIVFKDTMYFLYSGSDYRSLQNRPNHLLLWKSIETAHGKGLKYFDFGRTSADNYSLRQFKKYWGAEEIDINHYSFIDSSHPTLLLNRSNFQNNGFVNNIIKSLPVPLLKLIGNILYKHMG